MSNSFRAGVITYFFWIGLSFALVWKINGWAGAIPFLQAGFLCGLNLFSLGKVFANLAQIVSSVDPIKKRLLGLGAGIWGGIKLTSFFGIILWIWMNQKLDSVPLLLGLSGWIVVPMVAGLARRTEKRSK
jgi:hypothetical protein